MPQWSTHTTRAIRSEGPDMIDHLERQEAMQTWLFSQLWYAKHTKTQGTKRANFCCSVFSCTHGEDIEELCSAHMHWLWSYAMCLPEQWRGTLMHTNNSGAQPPPATLETIHNAFRAWGLFILYSNVCLHWEFFFFFLKKLNIALFSPINDEFRE